MAFSLNKRSSTHSYDWCCHRLSNPHHLQSVSPDCRRTTLSSVTSLPINHSSYSFIVVFCLPLPFSPWYRTSAHLLHRKPSPHPNSPLSFHASSFRSRWRLSFPFATDGSRFKTTKMSAYHFSS